MKITTKRQMYGLQSQHKLGNCLEVWYSIPDVRGSDYNGPIAIRGLKPGLKMQTHIHKSELEKATAEYCGSRGCRHDDLVYSEMAAPSMGIQRLLNAELMRTEQGLYLLWCGRNIHMDEAMRQAKAAERIVAKEVIGYFVDSCDADDLYSLLEQFPDSVIEFSVLQREVGWAKRRMLVWEVRNY